MISLLEVSGQRTAVSGKSEQLLRYPFRGLALTALQSAVNGKQSAVSGQSEIKSLFRSLLTVLPLPAPTGACA